MDRFNAMRSFFSDATSDSNGVVNPVPGLVPGPFMPIGNVSVNDLMTEMSHHPLERGGAGMEVQVGFACGSRWNCASFPPAIVVGSYRA